MANRPQRLTVSKVQAFPAQISTKRTFLGEHSSVLHFCLVGTGLLLCYLSLQTSPSTLKGTGKNLSTQSNAELQDTCFSSSLTAVKEGKRPSDINKVWVSLGSRIWRWKLDVLTGHGRALVAG